MRWAFFDAHRTPDSRLHNDEAAQRRMLGRVMEPNEVGCYSSHATVWRDFLASNADSLVVLEDDVTVDWAYLDFLTQHDLAVAGINFIRLFAKVPSRHHRIRTPFLSPYHHLVQNVDLALGMQAYILTREGARRLLKHCETIVRPIDVELDRSWVHGVPNLELRPSPVFERFVPSTIGEERLGRIGAAKPDKVAAALERLKKLRYRAKGKVVLDRMPARTETIAI